MAVQCGVSLALARFAWEEITIWIEQNVLTAEGRKTEHGDHQFYAKASRLVFGDQDCEDAYLKWHRPCSPAPVR